MLKLPGGWIAASLLLALGACVASAQESVPPPPAAEPPTESAKLRFIEPDNTSANNKAENDNSKTAIPPQVNPAWKSSNPAANTAPGRDPTEPSREIRMLLEEEGDKRKSNNQPTVNRAATAAAVAQAEIPEMRLKARIFSRDKPALAVLDIGGRSFEVHEGSQLNVPNRVKNAASVQLKVVKLSVNEIVIEFVNRHQTINLN